MRKWGFKKRFCIFASIFLVVFIVISWCIYAVVQNFIENNNKITFYVPDGAPALACAKLLSEDAKDDGRVIDVTCGRRTRAVIITDSDHVILSAIQAETVANRLDSNDTSIDDDEEEDE